MSQACQPVQLNQRQCQLEIQDCQESERGRQDNFSSNWPNDFLPAMSGQGSVLYIHDPELPQRVYIPFDRCAVAAHLMRDGGNRGRLYG